MLNLCITSFRVKIAGQASNDSHPADKISRHAQLDSASHSVKCLVAAALAMAAVSCDSDDKVIPAPLPATTSSVLILNSGNWGSNDATLVSYDIGSGTASGDIFSTANGKKLGDLANDMIIYGSKLYIAVSNSGVIFVCDLNGEIVKEIKEGTPRHFCSNEGKIYATLYEGYAMEIDTTSYAVKKVAVGKNPEGIAYSSGKLYVANSFGYDTSGQYGTTVSVLNASTFTVSKEITVNNNPQSFQVLDDGTVYLVTWGNYADIPAALQKINSAADAVTTVPGVAPTNMALGLYGEAWLLCSSYDTSWSRTISYYKYDTSTDTITGELVPSTDIPNGCCISYDPYKDAIYIGASDYVSNGDMYIVSRKGAVLNQFDTGGLNPVTVAFVRK